MFVVLHIHVPLLRSDLIEYILKGEMQSEVASILDISLRIVQKRMRTLEGARYIY